MATKNRKREAAAPVPVPASGAPKEKLDDRTPLDDLEAGKRKGRAPKEKLPEGYVRRIPGGTKRRVR